VLEVVDMNELQHYLNNKLLEILNAPQGSVIKIGKDISVQKLGSLGLEDIWQDFYDE
jgi:hypothetical protein